MNDCEVRGICLLCTQQKESLKVCLLEIQKRNSLQSFYMALFSNPVPALPQMPLLAYPAPSAPQNLLGRRRQRHQQEAAPGSTVLSRSCLLEMNAHRRAGAGHTSTGARKVGWVGGMGGHQSPLPAAPWAKQYQTCSWTQCAQGKPGISNCLCDRPSSSLSLPALPSLMPAGLYCYGNTMGSLRFSPPAL